MMSPSYGKLLVMVWLATSAVIGARSLGLDSGTGLDELGGGEVVRTGSVAKPEAMRELLCGEHSGPSVSARIWGGSDARLGEFPHQVNLQVNLNVSASKYWRFGCGGVLISRRFVLTAAHCVYYKNQTIRIMLKPEEVRVVLGSNMRHDPQHAAGTLINITKVTPHQQYNPHDGHINDIALLKLAKPVDFFLSETGLGSINRVCLPGQPNGQVVNNTRVVFSGWGQIGKGEEEVPSVLQKAELRIVAHSDCTRAWLDSVWHQAINEEKQICTVDNDHAKTNYYGDSGGALIRVLGGGRYELLGLFSFMDTFNSTWMPQGYTRVSPYLDWILDQMGSASNADKP